MSGVCGHSTPVKQGSYVIFAASGYARSYVHQFCEARGIGYKDLDGCFEDAREDSYIVHLDDYPRVHELLWNERAVLWLGPRPENGVRQAWVVYRNGEPTRYLGDFTRVTAQRAIREGNWTYDPTEGAYYVCINEGQLDLPLPVGSTAYANAA